MKANSSSTCAIVLFATAIMTCVIATPAGAQNQNRSGEQNNSSNFRGIVVGVADDMTSFTMVDGSGQLVTVKVTNQTAYDANRAAVNFSGAVSFGMEIRGTYASDGSAATVSARGRVDEIETEQLQPFMGASDDEWAILKPRIDRIQSLQRIIEGRNPNNNQRNAQNPPQRNLIPELKQTMQEQFFTLATPPATLRSTLQAFRDAQARARQELAAARNELRMFLTTRQEVLLVVMDILE